jgi:integrase/recombinase XerD
MGLQDPSTRSHPSGSNTQYLENYIWRIAQISLHFGRLPEQVGDDEVNEYLIGLALSAKSPSRSSFKHAVFGLRYYFRLIRHNKRAISLPSLKKYAKLPVILNSSELKELIFAQQLLNREL